MGVYQRTDAVKSDGDKPLEKVEERLGRLEMKSTGKAS